LAIVNHLGQKKFKAVLLVGPLSPISGDDQALLQDALFDNNGALGFAIEQPQVGRKPRREHGREDPRY